MTRIYITLFIVSQLLFFGCTTDSIERPARCTAVSAENETSALFLFRGETIYTQIMRLDARLIGYFSEKPNPISNDYFAVMDVRRELADNHIRTQSAQNTRTNNLSFSINGVDAQSIKSQQGTQGLRNMRAGGSPLFGNTVTFSLSSTNTSDEDGAGNLLRSGNNDNREVIMYVPELVEILSPRVDTERDILPYCFYRNFILEWNADPNNENGLVVAVEWNGGDIFGKRYGEYVINADILPNDNGRAILDNRLFDRIPQGAIANLILIRGNIEVIEDFLNEYGVEEAYRIVAASQAVLPFIMVREITIID